MSQLLRAFGLVLVLGGLGHSTGVIHLYVTEGVPDANRVLLDTWIGETHLIGGALYFTAFRAMRAGSAWRPFAIAGAVTVLAYAVPFIPVLFARAPLLFRIPPIVYALLSVFVVWQASRSATRDSRPHGAAGPGVAV